MRALLDACVLYPTILREILTGCAAAGQYTPLWSPRIIDEWTHAAARLGAGGAVQAQTDAALLRNAFPGAAVCPAPDAEAGLDLPDAGDLHVLAAAIAGHADAIVTLNLRDFPARGLAHHGLKAISPDDFLMDLWLADSPRTAAVVQSVRLRTEQISGEPQPLRPLLKRARLPRLGKALAG